MRLANENGISDLDYILAAKQLANAGNIAKEKYNIAEMQRVIRALILACEQETLADALKIKAQSNYALLLQNIITAFVKELSKHLQSASNKDKVETPKEGALKQYLVALSPVLQNEDLNFQVENINKRKPTKRFTTYIRKQLHADTSFPRSKQTFAKVKNLLDGTSDQNKSKLTDTTNLNSFAANSMEIQAEALKEEITLLLNIVAGKNTQPTSINLFNINRDIFQEGTQYFSQLKERLEQQLENLTSAKNLTQEPIDAILADLHKYAFILNHWKSKDGGKGWTTDHPARIKLKDHILSPEEEAEKKALLERFKNLSRSYRIDTYYRQGQKPIVTSTSETAHDNIEVSASHTDPKHERSNSHSSSISISSTETQTTQGGKSTVDDTTQPDMQPTLDALKKYPKETEDTNNIKQQQIMHLTDQLEKVTYENEQLKNMRDKAGIEVEKVISNNTALQTALGSIKKAHQKTLASLIKQLGTTTAERENFKRALQEQQLKLDTLSKENTASAENLENAKAEHQQRLQDITEKSTTLEETLLRTQVEHKKALAEFSEKLAHVQDEQQTKQQQKIIALTNEQAELVEKMTLIAGELGTSVKAKDELTQKLGTLQSERESALAKVNSLQQQLHSTTHERTELEKTLENAKTAHQVALQEQQLKLDTLSKENTASAENLENAKAEHQQRLQDITEKSTTLEETLLRTQVEHKKALAEFSEKLAHVQDEQQTKQQQKIIALTSEQAELVEKMTLIASELGTSVKAKDELANDLTNAKRKLKELTQELGTLQSEKEIDQTNLLAAQTERESALAKVNSLQQQLHSTTHERTELEKNLENAKAAHQVALQEQQLKLDTLSEEHTTIVESLTNTNTEKEQLSSYLSKLLDTMEDANHQIEFLLKQNENLQNALRASAIKHQLELEALQNENTQEANEKTWLTQETAHLASNVSTQTPNTGFEDMLNAVDSSNDPDNETSLPNAKLPQEPNRSEGGKKNPEKLGLKKIRQQQRQITELAAKVNELEKIIEAVDNDAEAADNTLEGTLQQLAETKEELIASQQQLAEAEATLAHSIPLNQAHEQFEKHQEKLRQTYGELQENYQKQIRRIKLLIPSLLTQLDATKHTTKERTLGKPKRNKKTKKQSSPSVTHITSLSDQPLSFSQQFAKLQQETNELQTQLESFTTQLKNQPILLSPTTSPQPTITTPRMSKSTHSFLNHQSPQSITEVRNLSKQNDPIVKNSDALFGDDASDTPSATAN